MLGVVGGNGKTGRAVIAAMPKSRAVGRNDFADLAAAFAGLSAAYVIAPNMHPDEPAFVERVLDAAKKVGITRIGYHSVAAPYVPEMPHHFGKAESERLIRTSGLAWTILQPGPYIQNFLPQLKAEQPELVVPYDPTKKFGLVDLNDVGEVVARIFADDAFIGATLELGGPEQINVEQLAKIGAEVLGKTVPVREISPTDWAAGPGANLEPHEREWLLAMFAYYDAHGLPVGAASTRAVLGRAPNSVAQVFARELAKN